MSPLAIFLEGVIVLSDKHEYKRGLIFKSPFSAYQLIVRPRRDIYNADGSVVIDVVPELVAEFGAHFGEFQYVDPDGQQQTAADIRGNYFDLDQQAEEKGWSDDDRALVASKMLRLQAKFAGDYQLHSAAPAPAPWPTFDKTHHNQVAALAAQLGLVGEALAYERQTKKRQSVLDGLEAEAVKLAAADDLVAA